MDISIAEKIVEDLGVKLNVKDIRFDILLSALEVGKVDIILARMSATDERRESVDFSDVYYIGGEISWFVRQTMKSIHLKEI
ncbi:transporter substrate-binding domain-containing protein [Carnobacterium iners]|uniref:transporter substrate-binding domain-containing protein n=1 Tax=Carnobacterium iners TaxID=1073423 RepID=UPI0008AE6808|nr:transporter substrate-binding domain-containing protein [Carnobacterium iners]SEK64477.1 extracellular solute-binding protein, family 3 [Carnobacterium iners]